MERRDTVPATGHRARYQPLVPLDRNQYQRLVAAMPSGWQVLADFLVLSGARLAEVAALSVDNIDLATGQCRITQRWRPINGGWILAPSPAPRTIVLPEQLLARLDLTHPGEELFRIDGAGGPGLILHFIRRIWRPAVDAVADDLPGGRRPGTAVLRATCGQWLAEAGVPWPVIAAHLGYRDTGAFVTQWHHLLAAADPTR
ncbi:site-specific integrase [Nocardia transvalensis]|uniref:site-specific integrase n=1 Tax=Nocardia transvalensis TaxID=37333 RepID=UPI001892D356|nr:site-specific integrase [Nocardia transvalensis]MBF6333246.1 site-specific integrase [Nocardia transvalensis]